jgi:hypothetical protein
VVERSEVHRSCRRSELGDLATEYKELDGESEAFHEFLKSYLADCIGYLTHTADITSIAIQEQQQTLGCFVAVQSREAVFGRPVLRSVGDFRPPRAAIGSRY